MMAFMITCYKIMMNIYDGMAALFLLNSLRIWNYGQANVPAAFVY